MRRKKRERKISIKDKPQNSMKSVRPWKNLVKV